MKHLGPVLILYMCIIQSFVSDLKERNESDSQLHKCAYVLHYAQFIALL